MCITFVVPQGKEIYYYQDSIECLSSIGKRTFCIPSRISAHLTGTENQPKRIQLIYQHDEARTVIRLSDIFKQLVDFNLNLYDYVVTVSE